MKQFKAVFFDLGYTLVKTDREVRLQQCLSQIGAQLSLPVLERAYHWADKLFMREYPGLLAKDLCQKEFCDDKNTCTRLLGRISGAR